MSLGEQAVARLEEGWRAVERTGNPTLRAAYWFLEGEVRVDADPDAALTALHRTIEIARSVDNHFIEGVARVAVASLRARHEEPSKALVEFREVVEHWRVTGDWVHMWTTLHNLLVLLRSPTRWRPSTACWPDRTPPVRRGPARDALPVRVSGPSLQDLVDRRLSDPAEPCEAGLLEDLADHESPHVT